MSDRKKYLRDYKRERRANARKQGICIICCKRRVRRGYSTCKSCIAKVNKD